MQPPYPTIPNLVVCSTIDQGKDFSRQIGIENPVLISHYQGDFDRALGFNQYILWVLNNWYDTSNTAESMFIETLIKRSKDYGCSVIHVAHWR